MTTYLTIITTALVITQIIRVVQNAVSLYRERKAFEENCEWVKDTNIQREDFIAQMECYKLVTEYLKSKMERCKEDE